MEPVTLREILRGPVVDLHSRGTHAALPGICERLGLPSPNTEGSKRERMRASYDAADDSALPMIAEKFLRDRGRASGGGLPLWRVVTAVAPPPAAGIRNVPSPFTPKTMTSSLLQLPPRPPTTSQTSGMGYGGGMKHLLFVTLVRWCGSPRPQRASPCL
jgi:hypothetical protein